jgi:hypothetical protein
VGVRTVDVEYHASIPVTQWTAHKKLLVLRHSGKIKAAVKHMKV